MLKPTQIPWLVALIWGGAVMTMSIQDSRGEAMVQYFNTSWKEITRKMPELAEAGYESIWLPPPTKGS
ncbi:MAG: hypothetical protein AAF591_19695, partial [Verrucomicrobiota bacterium]